MTDLIQAAHLHRMFGPITAVGDVDLRVGAGEIYGLVGPDGAGKTTMIRLLCGAYLPTPLPDGSIGRVNIAGFDIHRQTEAARACIGYLPQRFSLYEELTVIENLRFFAEVRGLPGAEWQPRCMEILEFVGLAEFVQRRAGQLSGGMKQKLGLAAALVHRPQVLLLDEPTTGVDPVTRQDFWQLILGIIGQFGDMRTAALVSTPYMDEAARCSRIGFMTAGRIVLEGPPAQLRRRLDGRVVELAGRPLPALRHLSERDPAVSGVQMFGDRLHLRILPGRLDEALDRLAKAASQQGLQVDRLRPIPAQLEDVFMDLLEAQDELA